MGCFTILSSDKVIDYVDGREDLARKLIRAIGQPSKRFAEDRLRMLRAIRFASTLGVRDRVRHLVRDQGGSQRDCDGKSGTNPG